MSDTLILYPSNWLYNAGVIGLLKVLESGGENVENSIKDNGQVEIDKKIFTHGKNYKELPFSFEAYITFFVQEDDFKKWKEKNKSKISENYPYVFEKLGEFGYQFIYTGNKLFASKTPFQNLIQISKNKPEWQNFKFVKLIKDLLNFPASNCFQSENRCILCGNSIILSRDIEKDLQDRLIKLQITHLKELGASINEFPNSFWGLNQSSGICVFCVYLLLHIIFAFTKLSDTSEIFINAPSFKAMYYLNKFAQELLGTTSEIRTKREILAMSIIEYAIKIQTTIGIWTGMNIEIVSKVRKQKDTKIEFFSLPYETVRLLSDRNIASILSQIGEFNILNKFLDGKYSELIELGYRLLKIGLKPFNELAKSEREFLNNNLRLERNRRNPKKVADQIFKLCALVEEKQKGGMGWNI